MYAYSSYQSTMHMHTMHRVLQQAYYCTSVVVGILQLVGISLPAGTLPQNTYYPKYQYAYQLVLTSRRKKQTAGTPFPARPPLAVDGRQEFLRCLSIPGCSRTFTYTLVVQPHAYTTVWVCKKINASVIVQYTTRMSLILLSTSSTQEYLVFYFLKVLQLHG